MTLRQTSEIPGPSHGVLQSSTHLKLNLPHCKIKPPVLNHKKSLCSAQSTPIPVHIPSQSRPQPESIQHSSPARFVNPEPSHSASGHLITDPSHRSPLHTHLLLNPNSTKHPHKSLQSASPQEAELKT